MQDGSIDITISVPASLADSGAAARARLLLVLDAVRRDLMTFRAAAQALDIAPDQLLDIAREHGVPVTRYERADLEGDLSTLAKLERLRASGG